MIFSLFFLLPDFTVTNGFIFRENKNFSLNYDLHFVYYDKFENSQNPSQILANYSNRPKVLPVLLDSGTYNKTGFTIRNKFWTLEGSPSIGRLRKIRHFSGLVSLLDISLITRLPVINRRSRERPTLLGRIILYMTPVCIFSIVDDVSRPQWQHYAEYPKYFSKLFLISRDLAHLYVSRLDFRFPPLELSSRNVALATLVAIWDSINTRNMNRRLLISDNTNYVHSTCMGRARTIQDFGDELFCPVSSLRNKHNFTLYPRSTFYDTSRIVTNLLIQPDREYDTFAVANLRYEKIKFLVITDFPMKGSSFEAFASPFDIYTGP